MIKNLSIIIDRMKKKLSIERESGYVLVVTLVILALGALLITPVASLMMTNMKASNATELMTDTFYAADSGMEYALFYVINNTDSLPDSNSPTLDISFNTSINGAFVETTIIYVTEGIYNIIVEANKFELEGYQTIISSYINIGFNTDSVDIFRDVITTIGGGITSGSNTRITGNIFSNKSFSLTGSSVVTGNVYAETNIQLGPAASIVGDAYAQGTIQRPQNITGSVNPGAENRDPTILEETLLNGIIENIRQGAAFTPQAAGVVTRTGNWALGYWPLPDSVYPNAEHVTGNMTIATGISITFSDSIHVDGNLTINCSDGTITFDGPVIVAGDIIIQNGNVIFNDYVYAGDTASVSNSSVANFSGDVRVENDFTLGLRDSISFGGTIYVGGGFEAAGDYNINVAEDIYVADNLILKYGATLVGGVTVVVLGDTTFSSSTKLDVAEIPFFIVPSGSLTFPTSDYVSAAIYAPSAKAVISGNVTLYGAILSNDLSLKFSSKIEYAGGIVDNPNIVTNIVGTPEGEFEILSWNIV
jgi:predicted acyltransferase (DUF342 family)